MPSLSQWIPRRRWFPALSLEISLRRSVSLSLPLLISYSLKWLVAQHDRFDRGFFATSRFTLILSFRIFHWSFVAQHSRYLYFRNLFCFLLFLIFSFETFVKFASCPALKLELVVLNDPNFRFIDRWRRRLLASDIGCESRDLNLLLMF